MSSFQPCHHLTGILCSVFIQTKPQPLVEPGAVKFLAVSNDIELSRKVTPRDFKGNQGTPGKGIIKANL